jgi:hypothetical protein
MFKIPVGRRGLDVQAAAFLLCIFKKNGKMHCQRRKEGCKSTLTTQSRYLRVWHARVFLPPLSVQAPLAEPVYGYVLPFSGPVPEGVQGSHG